MITTSSVATWAVSHRWCPAKPAIRADVRADGGVAEPASRRVNRLNQRTAAGATDDDGQANPYYDVNGSNTLEPNDAHGSSTSSMRAGVKARRILRGAMSLVTAPRSEIRRLAGSRTSQFAHLAASAYACPRRRGAGLVDAYFADVADEDGLMNGKCLAISPTMVCFALTSTESDLSGAVDSAGYARNR
jgi:hypothetical protein